MAKAKALAGVLPLVVGIRRHLREVTRALRDNMTSSMLWRHMPHSTSLTGKCGRMQVRR